MTGLQILGTMQQAGGGAEAGQGGLHCADDSGDGDGGSGSGVRDYDVVELERAVGGSGGRRGEAREGGAMKVVWWRRQSGGGLPPFLTSPITPAFIAHHF